jgi:8-oxo-dGTP pyrophosphatase MutT (NUDIX family)
MDYRKRSLKMPEKKFLYTAGLIVIKDNKLLLAYSGNKKAWYLPGGKIDAGENSIQALEREIWEELNIKLQKENLKFYCHISAPAYGEENNIIMEQDCFIYELNQKISPNAEIEAVQFFDFQMYEKEDIQVIGVVEVFANLIKDQLLY